MSEAVVAQRIYEHLYPNSRPWKAMSGEEQRRFYVPDLVTLEQYEDETAELHDKLERMRELEYTR